MTGTFAGAADDSDGLRQLRRRLLGRQILAVEEGGAKLLLNDGTVLHLYINDCCDAVADGSWVIEPDVLDAVITDVRLVDRKKELDDDGRVTNYITITILHNQNPVALAYCSANNGCYCSTLTLAVLHKLGKTKHDFRMVVVTA